MTAQTIRQRLLAHLRYAHYVARHKWYVFLYGWAVGAIPPHRLILHDWTKYLPWEWNAYVQYFYGDRDRKRTATAGESLAFDVAWNHHQKRNPHHWQYWVLVTDQDKPRLRPLPMPDSYAREMVADWCGAGAAQDKLDIRSWYLQHKDGIILHPDTRQLVEQILLDLKQRNLIM